MQRRPTSDYIAAARTGNEMDSVKKKNWVRTIIDRHSQIQRRFSIAASNAAGGDASTTGRRVNGRPTQSYNLPFSTLFVGLRSTIVKQRPPYKPHAQSL